jgi:drug/metabolite transporter (DMT)-like permease
MTGLAVVLVLVSALAHASWNLIVRRSDQPELTNWLMLSSGALLASPIAIFVLLADPPDLTGWLFIAGTTALHIGYFFTLGRAYRYGDLSLVYPIARGLGLALIPFAGVFVLAESVSVSGALGIAVIFVGVVVVGSSTRGSSGGEVSTGGGRGIWRQPRSLLADRGVVFAVLTGILIATYSAFDKRGVDHVEPIVYMFMMTVGGSLGILPLIGRNYTRHDFAGEIRNHWKVGLAGGALQFTVYTLVLSAFRLSPVSYVGPFRELGIVFGVVMAWLILKESVSLNRAIGAAAIGSGAILVAIAP